MKYESPTWGLPRLGWSGGTREDMRYGREVDNEARYEEDE
jgi:hypothetical protein